MTKFCGKRIIPAAAILALYTLISILYFAPQLGGEVLVQGDVTQYKGMTQDILESRERTGRDPQWSGSLFGGMPAYLINIAYPSMIIRNTTSALTRLIPAPAAYTLFAMTAMWLMLAMMGLNMWVAALGGLMYGLSTYLFLIIDAGHITKIWALIYAPLMFGGAWMALRGNIWVGGSLFALFTSLEIGANHPQITYYFILTLAAFWISEAVVAYRKKLMKPFAKRTVVMLAAGVLAVGSNFSALWYTYQHTADTMRGGSILTQDSQASTGLDLDYATAWSYGRIESFNMLIPDFVGRDSANSFSENGAVAESLRPYGAEAIAQQIPTYWGGQPFTGGPTYLGAVVLFLAVLGFCLTSNRQRWWILGVSLFMLLLAWGRNFMWFTELMFDILPGYNKFRTVSMTLTVVEFTIPLLATFGVAKLWAREVSKDSLARALGWGAGLTAGLSMVFILFAGSLFDFDRAGAISMLIDSNFPDDLAVKVAGAMVEERRSIMTADAWRTILFVMAAAAVVWCASINIIKRGVMLALLSALVLFDMVGVNTRFLNYDNFVSPVVANIRPTEANRQIMADKELGYRVFNLTVSPFNDATTSYFHRSVGGYHGAKLSRYQDLIDNYLSRQTPEVLDMLNTKYLITNNGVIERESRNGAAWFVKDILEVDTPQEEMATLGVISTKEVAVVEKGQGIHPTSFGQGEIELVSYEPNWLLYKYSLEEAGVAVFSEVFYRKGWRAYIDSKPAPYFRVNYLLRGMELPAGNNHVLWEFRAPAWWETNAITLICSLIIIISLIAALLYERRQKTKA